MANDRLDTRGRSLKGALRGLCDNYEVRSSAAKGGLIVSQFRHGSSRALTKNGVLTQTLGAGVGVCFAAPWFAA
jgi:hypothetical protein